MKTFGTCLQTGVCLLSGCLNTLAYSRTTQKSLFMQDVHKKSAFLHPTSNREVALYNNHYMKRVAPQDALQKYPDVPCWAKRFRSTPYVFSRESYMLLLMLKNWFILQHKSGLEMYRRPWGHC
uniref:Uncharacterized protein n=1 Tax=Rhodnius prolixus TaxID=13249 RepID=T1I5Y8_RHOPR